MIENIVEARETVEGCIIALEDMAETTRDSRLSMVTVALRACAEWLGEETARL